MKLKVLALREKKLDKEKKKLNKDFIHIKNIDNEEIIKKKDHKMIGDKIILKKQKVKYSSVKNKIIKNYKEMSQQLIVPIYSNKINKETINNDSFSNSDNEYSEDELVIEKCDNIKNDSDLIELNYAEEQ